MIFQKINCTIPKKSGPITSLILLSWTVQRHIQNLKGQPVLEEANHTPSLMEIRNKTITPGDFYHTSMHPQFNILIPGAIIYDIVHSPLSFISPCTYMYTHVFYLEDEVCYRGIKVCSIDGTQWGDQSWQSCALIWGQLTTHTDHTPWQHIHCRPGAAASSVATATSIGSLNIMLIEGYL